MIYTVYILFSAVHDKIYIGCTSDLIKRFHSHNSLGTKGWTIKYRPWTVVYAEYFKHKSEAFEREKILKTSKERKWIREKIVDTYPTMGFISA